MDKLKTLKDFEDKNPSEVAFIRLMASCGAYNKSLKELEEEELE